MKRCVKYNIDMNWKLDPLRLMDFPFDVQDLTVWFRGASDYRTSAPSDFTGSSAGKHQYRLREARKHSRKDKNGKDQPHCGSDFLKVCAFQDHEFDVVAISTELVFHHSETSYEPTNLKVHLHMVRRPLFFINQIVFPLWMTTLLGFTLYAVPIDMVNDRVTIAITCLVAQFALLYTAQEQLPNLSKLTVIDVIIIMSIVLTFVSGALSVVVYWVNKGDSGKQDTFWGDSLDAHLNGWLLVATLIAYHGGMAFVLHKADCPGLSFGQSTKKVQQMVCRGVSETTDIQCDPKLLKKIKEDPEALGGKNADRKELEFWPNEDGVKNALWLISKDSTKYCYEEKIDGKWVLSTKPIEYRTDAKQPKRFADSADTKCFLYSGEGSGHWHK